MLKIKRYTLSLVISFIIAAIFLSLSAVLFTYTNINDRYLDSFVFGIVTISVLVGSLLLCRRFKEKGLLYGASFGLIYCLIIYLFNVLAFNGFFVSNALGIYFSICILSGMIGGIVGVNV